MSRKVSAVVLAAGRGVRFGADRNKAFVELKGRTLLQHSLERLRASECVDELIVVLSEADLVTFGDQVRADLAGHANARIVTGGARRQDSARAGYEASDPEADIVLVHDSVRPLVPPPLVRALVEAAEEHGAAAPALPATDSVKEGAEGYLVRSIPRSIVHLTQTPQAFGRSVYGRMCRAVEEAGRDVTDDAEMAEVAGVRVRIVPGHRVNLKVTTPEDLLLAECLLDRLASNAS